VDPAPPAALVFLDQQAREDGQRFVRLLELAVVGGEARAGIEMLLQCLNELWLTELAGGELEDDWQELRHVAWRMRLVVRLPWRGPLAERGHPQLLRQLLPVGQAARQRDAGAEHQGDAAAAGGSDQTIAWGLRRAG